MTVMEFVNAHRDDEDDCECMVLPDGSVEEPLPSHINKLAALAGKDSAFFNSYMEKNMEPLFWLVEYTGCVSVWKTRVVSPTQPTQAQLDVLEELQAAALLAPKYLLQKVDAAYLPGIARARQAQ